MRIDEKAKLFLRKAKESGVSKEEAFSTLQQKGYEVPSDIGVAQQPTIQAGVQESQKQIVQPIEGFQVSTQDLLKMPREQVNKVFPSLSEEQQREYFQQKQSPELTTGQVAGSIGEAVGHSAAGVARDVAESVPLVGGYADNAEAYARSKITGRTSDKELENIRKEKEQYSGSVSQIPLASTAREASKIALSIGMGGMAGKTIGGGSKIASALGSLGGRVATGAVEGAGHGDKDALTGALLGGAVGAIAPSLVRPAIKYGSKALKYIAPELTEKLSKKIFQDVKTPGKDISEIAGSDESMEIIGKGIDSNPEIAKQVTAKANSAIRSTPERLTGKINKALDVKNIRENLAEGGKQYKSYLQVNGKKKLPKQVFEDLIYNKKILRMIGDVKQANPRLKGLDNNSLPVLQETNSMFRSIARGKLDIKESTLAQKASENLKNVMNKNFEGFSEIQKVYRKAKQPEVLYNHLTKFDKAVDKNYAKALDKNDIISDIGEYFGETKMNNFVNVLQNESMIHKNLKGVLTKSQGKIKGQGLRQVFGKELGKQIDTTSIGLGGAAAFGAVNPLIPIGLMVAKVGVGGTKRLLAKKGALKLLGTTKKDVAPIIRWVSSQQASGLSAKQISQSMKDK